MQERKKRQRSMKKSFDSIPAFLLKTYDILENPTYSDIISWNEDGTAFTVKKVNEFSEQILPKSFKHSNFASFVRQLNMYDFHKTRHDNNDNEFKHQLFRKGQKDLLTQIKRKTNEQKEQNALSLTKTELILNGNADSNDNLPMQMALLAHKQNELEKLVKIIIKQNEKYQKENKYLWNELMKNKNKNESQQDRVLRWFLQSLNTPKQQKLKSQQQMLMIKPASDEIEDSQQQFEQQLPIKHFFNGDDRHPTFPQNIDASLEGLSKKQILQALLHAINNQSSDLKKLKKKHDDDEISLVSEDDYPIQKRVQVEPQHQLMLEYQDQKYVFYLIYFLHRNRIDDDNFIIQDQHDYLSRRDSFNDYEPIHQFFEEQL